MKLSCNIIYGFNSLLVLPLKMNLCNINGVNIGDGPLFIDILSGKCQYNVDIGVNFPYGYISSIHTPQLAYLYMIPPAAPGSIGPPVGVKRGEVDSL